MSTRPEKWGCSINRGMTVNGHETYTIRRGKKWVGTVHDYQLAREICVWRNALEKGAAPR